MDQGPDEKSGHAVLDNLNINNELIGHEWRATITINNGGLFSGTGRRVLYYFSTTVFTG
jgi:hypothetical protein